MKRIDASNLKYNVLNDIIRRVIEEGENKIIIDGVCGQYYIGCGIAKPVEIVINGVPGNDLGAFMEGPTIIVNEDAQDGIGNTMSSGEIIIHGNAGDVLGYSMRGGSIFVKGNVGYRACIHMKAYKEDVSPTVVIGMHGGAIFVRQDVDESLCSSEVLISKPDDKDMQKILINVKKFCDLFGFDCDKIIKDEFVKITPKSKRPYGNLYIPGP